MTEAIYYILNNDAGVTALIGSSTACRCYPVIVPETVTFPYVMFQQISGVPENTQTGARCQHSRVQVNCYDLLNKGAKDLGDAVRTALERVTAGSYAGVTIMVTTVLEGGRDMYAASASEDGVFWRMLEFDIFHV